MDYKDNKKPMRQNHYDTERGMRKFLTQVLNATRKYGPDPVMSVINESIANNYMGITWGRVEKLKAKNGQDSVFDEWRNA